ncbi:glycine-rich RNA-binding protein 3, mitochondrial-like [Miscanthus floridulus]|uniref:glycine-rich RNA-binding protein 3, mitochondrial-like n=1 Tax=Miscanthus floridulus TaxID=154761 RepID=UPI00345B16C6
MCTIDQIETSRELNICETADDYWAAYDRDSQKNVRLCSIPNLQIVMEAKECSYQSKARLNIVKSLAAHLENLTGAGGAGGGTPRGQDAPGAGRGSGGGRRRWRGGAPRAGGAGGDKRRGRAPPWAGRGAEGGRRWGRDAPGAGAAGGGAGHRGRAALGATSAGGGEAAAGGGVRCGVCVKGRARWGGGI